MDREIRSIKPYGKMHITLKQQIDKRNITVTKLSHMTGISRQTLEKWYKDDVNRINLDVLARICYVLDLKPNDIINE